MRIVIDPGTYNCLNMGDLAMLQVAVQRLRSLVPCAELQVITDTPEALLKHCPGVQPLSAAARRVWCDDRTLIRGQRYIPKALLIGLLRAKRWLRRRWVRGLHILLRYTHPLKVRPSELVAFIEAVNSADCLVVCGQGFLTDHVRDHAITTLNMVEIGLGHKAVCAMVGQGIGPLRDRAVIAQSREVLPELELLSLRERVAGLPICRSIGVPEATCSVSGDEAIELACAYHRDPRVNGLGINVRVAPSSGVESSFLNVLRPILEEFAVSVQAEFIPLPIARDHDLGDVRSIQRLFAGTKELTDGGLSLDSPQAVIEQASRCRIIVTGAYHAAVFALAQGVPAVCLAKSEYFETKFAGLADQFGQGCRVLSLQDPAFERHLKDALVWAWDSAPQLETPLRKAAQLQVLKSYRVYNRLGRILRRKYADALICPLTPPYAKPKSRVLSRQAG
jgi:colanic acid/amylovoran biosynthesis protein